jgi:flagellar biosynthesis protein
VRKAVALRYDRQVNQAPEVVAAGQGLVAERLLEIAKAHGIPRHEDQELVEALLKVPVGAEIPPGLYELVARVLAFVLRMEEQEGKKQERA